MRQPAVAGRFYPSGEDDLVGSIEWCFEHPLGPGLPGECTGDRRISAVMVPHAGYACSGMVAAHSYRALAEDGHPDAYVVIGPDHHGTCPGSILCSEDHLTPLGPCPVHRGICERLSATIPDIPRAHAYEHSIEVEVPFIQYIDPDARIVPILMGDQSYSAAEHLAGCIRDACRGYDVVVVASTDMSHYVPHMDASRLDSQVLDKVVSGDVTGMYRTIRENRVTMCGFGPTAVAMMLSEGSRKEVLRYSDSYDSLGLDPDAVVGYASAVFGR